MRGWYQENDADTRRWLVHRGNSCWRIGRYKKDWGTGWKDLPLNWQVVCGG